MVVNVMFRRTFHGGDVCEGVIEKKVGWCIGRLR
jgi:hypothetical protein